ncbi:MAG: alpha-1,2-fucosyltransferase [Flavobacteriales bacterium]|nr:MAG: alpha-1,2-fucosyltransferase [Flavobacteriales bacterium]
MSIIVKLMGGLGNQLFQYALGRRIELERGVDVAFDLDHYDRTTGPATYRAPGLDAFNVTMRTADAASVQRARFGGPLRSGLHRLHPRLAPERTVREASMRFDASVLQAVDGSYLEGYWQSERYFDPVAPALRQEIVLRTPLQGSAAEAAQRIRSVPAISVHVRRGDYVNQAAASAHFHTCTPSYYQQAMERMLVSSPDARYFVFSDDMAWSRAHIRSDRQVHFVELGAPPHIDMYLMSLCDHHVMANSSFSWWGAWLNPSPDKRVIAPLRWFKDPAIDTADLLPVGWERL